MPDDSVLFGEVKALNRVLKADDRTLDVVAWLGENRRDLAHRYWLRDESLALLALTTKRYDLAQEYGVNFMRLYARAEESYNTSMARYEGRNIDPVTLAALSDAMAERFVCDVLPLIEGALAFGEETTAKAIQLLSTEAVDDPRLRAALAE